MKKYVPIACSFYDLLESLAVKKEAVRIVFNSNGEQKEIMDVIVTFKTINKQEFLVLKSGAQIRLDLILYVNRNNVTDHN